MIIKFNSCYNCYTECSFSMRSWLVWKLSATFLAVFS